MKVGGHDSTHDCEFDISYTQDCRTGLKLNIQNTKIIASGPITSWQIEGKKAEAVIYFIFLGSKITAVGDCSHEIKRCLLLGRKAMTNLDSVLKIRDITSLIKVHLVKDIFPPPRGFYSSEFFSCLVLTFL